ncbi:response regulator [Larkinella sp. VNQ87]|uniref:response regulator n=1 Tax=Larkinella sp. VNQ87 TaxID=3400921 RepID=UPI003C118DDD
MNRDDEMTRKRRILIVDDDVTYRQLLTLYLTKAGYDVLIANDGQDALSWLRSPEQRPDLVLLDLLMPRFSGIDFLENQKMACHKIPVILISGAEPPIARQGIAQATPDAFLSKPFNVEDLLQKIEALLQSVSEVD